MRANPQLEAVARVLKRSTRYTMPQGLADLFEENIDPSQFMSVDHVRRLYGFLIHLLFGRRRIPIRYTTVGDYIVVIPDPREDDVKRRIDHVYWHMAVASYLASWGPSTTPEALVSVINEYPRLANLGFPALVPADFYKPSDRSHLAGLHALYTVGSSAPAWDVPAAVIGVDSDTGKLFVRTLPPGMGAVAALAWKELEGGSLEAVRAILGYDYELGDYDGEIPAIVRLQGDLYVRLDAYLNMEPGEAARLVTAAWEAASHVVRGLRRLAEEAARAYTAILSGIMPEGGDLPLAARAKASLLALQAALSKLHPWLFRGPCARGEPGCDDQDNGRVMWGVGAERPGRSTILEEPAAPAPAHTLEIPPSPRVDPVLIEFRGLRGGERGPLAEDPAGVFSGFWDPLWAAAALMVLSVAEPPRLPRPSEDGYAASLAEALAFPARLDALLALQLAALTPAGNTRLPVNVGVPMLVAAAAAYNALAGRPAPEPVVEALRRLEPALVEARVGDHRVWVEGYLLRGPAAEGVRLAETAYDLESLGVALGEAAELLGLDDTPVGYYDALHKLAKSRRRGAAELRVEAAKYASRVIQARRGVLAVVTPGSTSVEAEHPEHGRAGLELLGPMLATVATNPAVDYEGDLGRLAADYGGDALPAYLL